MHERMIAAVLTTVLSVPAAQATLFNFSYELQGGGILAGQLDGTLQGDNNTVVVNSILDFATFNGVPQISLPFVESFDEFLGYSGPLDPIVTLDGSFMDIIACESNICIDGFLFAVGSLYDSDIGGPIYSSGSSFGDAFESFSQPNWSISAVPEPATLALFGLGLAGIGALRRKKLAA